MIYRFKSRSSGDLIMLEPQGKQLLRLIGREPAAQGIIETAAMPSALAALQAAMAAEEQPANDPGTDEPAAPSVGLRQRLWPMVDMLRRCHAAGEAVVWGV